MRNLPPRGISSAPRRDAMSGKVDLYNTTYGNAGVDVYSEIRRETYGLDIGQTSWLSAEELEEIPRVLDLNTSSSVLEIGCGAGGCAVHFATTIGCHVTGIDVNEQGLHAAEQEVRTKGLGERARFLQHDAGTGLPFPEQSFDAAYSNDAFCHIPNRLALLRECGRVLKRRGRLLFSDALVVNGALSNEELATRSSIGVYIFVPRGENERLIGEAGLTLVRAQDTTKQAAAISQKWCAAREGRRPELIKIEGETNFAGLQKFLNCVHALTSENRLARFLYLATA